MPGTFAFCRTTEAVKRMNDGDIIQNLDSDLFFKQEGDTILFSIDCNKWNIFREPMNTFPPFVEWRSLSNLHYYNDLVMESSAKIQYLTVDDVIIEESNPLADKTKKRWFINNM